MNDMTNEYEIPHGYMDLAIECLGLLDATEYSSVLMIAAMCTKIKSIFEPEIVKNEPSFYASLDWAESMYRLYQRACTGCELKASKNNLREGLVLLEEITNCAKEILGFKVNNVFYAEQDDKIAGSLRLIEEEPGSLVSELERILELYPSFFCFPYRKCFVSWLEVVKITPDALSLISTRKPAKTETKEERIKFAATLHNMIFPISCAGALEQPVDKYLWVYPLAQLHYETYALSRDKAKDGEADIARLNKTVKNIKTLLEQVTDPSSSYGQELYREMRRENMRKDFLAMKGVTDTHVIRRTCERYAKLFPDADILSIVRSDVAEEK